MCVSYIEREKREKREKKVDLIKPHIQYYLLNPSFTATPNFDSLTWQSNKENSRRRAKCRSGSSSSGGGGGVVLITSITNISHSLLSCRLWSMHVPLFHLTLRKEREASILYESIVKAIHTLWTLVDMLSIYVRVIPTKSYLFCYPEIGPLKVKRKKRREREREREPCLFTVHRVVWGARPNKWNIQAAEKK